MERRIESADGRVLRIRVPGTATGSGNAGADPADPELADAELDVAGARASGHSADAVDADDDVFVDEDGYDGSGVPGAPKDEHDDRDPDGLDEGATEAVILVEPKPNAMLVEGAVAAVGVVARHLAGPRDAPEPQGWWRDWGMYVIPLALVLVAAMAMQILG